MRRKKTILVTGGLGFIGQAISLSLSRNNSVIIIDNNFRKKNIDKLKKNNIKIINADITNEKNLNKIKQKIDCVVHLAFINGTNYFYENPQLVLNVGIKGIINIIDFCKKKSIREFFLASSSEVYQNAKKIPTNEEVPLIIPDPHNPRYSYGAGKIISEIMLINCDYFKRSVIFRPHNIYGPNMGYNHVIPELIKKIRSSRKKITIQGKGQETRAFCYIDDFISAFNILIKKGKNKNIYNIGTEEEVKIKDLTNRVIKLSNKRISIKKSIEKKGNAKRRCPDIKKIKKLGYKPEFNLNKGLKITYDWYLKDLNNEI